MSTEAPTADLASQFRHFIMGLCDVIAEYIERDGSAVPLMVAIITRLCRRRDRLMALLARFHAGTLLPPRPGRVRPASIGARAPDPAPRCRGYLARLLKHEGAVYGRILAILLADPETTALLAASPQAGRLLRPLWRMLSLRPYPPALQPVPRDLASPAARPPTPVRPTEPPRSPRASPEVPDAPAGPAHAIQRAGSDPPTPA